MLPYDFNLGRKKLPHDRGDAADCSERFELLLVATVLLQCAPQSLDRDGSSDFVSVLEAIRDRLFHGVHADGDALVVMQFDSLAKGPAGKSDCAQRQCIHLGPSTLRPNRDPYKLWRS